MFDVVSDRRRPSRARQTGAVLLALLFPVSAIGALGLLGSQAVTEAASAPVVQVDFPVEDFGKPPPGPKIDGRAARSQDPAPKAASEPEPEPEPEPETEVEPDEAPGPPEEAAQDLTPGDAVADLGAGDGPGRPDGDGLGGGGTDPDGDCPECAPGGQSGPASLHWSQVKVLHQVEPRMPAQARSFPGDYQCDVRFVIDPRGRVEDVQVVECPDLFVASTLKAARRWRFSPYVDANGVARQATFLLQVTYRVD